MALESLSKTWTIGSPPPGAHLVSMRGEVNGEVAEATKTCHSHQRVIGGVIKLEFE